MEHTQAPQEKDRDFGHIPSSATETGTDLATSQEPKAEQYRRRTADVLERTATKVRELGAKAPGGEKSTRWGQRAGGGIEQAADYLRERSVDEISHDVQGWVQKNPAPALASAAAFGFLAGVLLRRR